MGDLAVWPALPAAVGGGPVRYRWALGTTRWGRDVLDWQDLAGTNSTQNVTVRRWLAWMSVSAEPLIAALVGAPRSAPVCRRRPPARS